MASELMAVVVSDSLKKAKDMAMDKIDLMMRFSQELDAMKRHVEAMEAMLADAEKKKHGNQRVLQWLKDVEGVSFEAEIVLDELFYESLRRRVLENSVGAQEVCSSFLLMLNLRIRDIYFRVVVGSRVRDINVRFEKFNSEVPGIETLRVRDLLYHQFNEVAANRATDSRPPPFVEGRKEEERTIVDLLLSASSDDNIRIPVLPVLPIVGMGGLGKTTLAKTIYNNEKIVGHFKKRSWTCVSDKVAGTDVLKGILESLKEGQGVGISERDAIVQGIQKELKGERFLFVLDDVWESEWWEKLLESLAGINPARGSCCVLTTRTRTKKYNCLFDSFELGKLAADACWSIVTSKATGGRNETPDELNVLREQILNRCQGLPLAANIIGGLLSSQNEENWRGIVENRLNDPGSVDDKIMPILRLSYEYLPSRSIKKCFVYCSVYPKDAMMRRDELIQLWMAEGFLQEAVDGGRTMEEVGAGYCTILLQASLLEICTDYRGDYQMHDLVHDLAESISKEQHRGDKHPAFRHVRVGPVDEVGHSWNEKSMLARNVEGEICDKMLLKYRHARVMHLFFSGLHHREMPKDVGKLKHVRYLTLSGWGIERLPESVCELYGLQTLSLQGCYRLLSLPQGFANLISLRHLHCSMVWFKMPPYMGRLTCLQTLDSFNVGEENGCGIGEVGFMENLKGSLTVRNLELVKSKEEASSAKLVDKKNMTDLRFIWGSTASRNGDSWREDEHVLEGLEPCSALRRLTIENFMGVRFPAWLEKLPALKVLDLDHCENTTQLGSSDDLGFPKLKELRISGCCQLSSAPTSFPVLKVLSVRNTQIEFVRDIISKTADSLEDLLVCGVSRMRSLSDVIKSPLSCLKKLGVYDCPDLIEIPSSAFKCCTSLSYIAFYNCPKMFTTTDSVPGGFQHLTSLKHLHIQDCSMPLFDWDGLKEGCSTTLETLVIFGYSCPQLPQQLQHFSSLLELSLLELDSIESLPDWLGSLTSLKRLVLHDCPKLQHLPVQAIRSLNNLRLLQIGQGCPLLKEKIEGGEIDITGLPNLVLDR